MALFGPKKEIRRVKIIGVRTAMESKTLWTENYGVYSFLIEYTDGSCAIKEAQLGKPDMAQLMQYIQYDYT